MSFPRYERYKDSGVEWLSEVPEHWELKRLKHCFRLLTEKTNRRENPVALENVESWSGRFIKTETAYEGYGVAFERGDILFGKLRPYLAKAYLTENQGEAIGDFHVLRPKGAAYSRFSQYQILNREFIGVVDGSTFGAKMPRVSWDFLGDIILTVPPFSEQQTIVSFLDRETAKIDELIAEQQRLIELLKEKRQAVISHAVTKGLNPDAPMKDSGIEWLGEVPKHWEVQRLTKCVKNIVDYRGKTPTKVDDGIFLLTARNIKDGAINYDISREFVSHSEYNEIMRRGKPSIGDLVFTMEAPLGQVANIDITDIAIAQRIIKLQGHDERANNYFLKYWFMGTYSQSQLGSLATGSTALGLKASKLGQLNVCLPPMNEQISITNYLESQSLKFDTLITQAQRAIELLKERRTALISAAVTGKIDVRGLVSDERVVG